MCLWDVLGFCVSLRFLVLRAVVHQTISALIFFDRFSTLLRELKGGGGGGAYRLNFKISLCCDTFYVKKL